MGDDTSGVEGILSTSISSSNCSDEAAEGFSSSESLGITYSSPKGTISFDGMLDIGTSSIGFAKQLVKAFTFLGAEDSKVDDAFLFFTAARSTALIFFTSNAEGRIGRGVGAGGAEGIGSFTSGTAVEASAGLTISSGATLVVALVISSAAGMESSALVL